MDGWNEVQLSRKSLGGDSMKVGDLCRVIGIGTHIPNQFGDYVILLKPLDKNEKVPMCWKVLNQKTGKIHAHWSKNMGKVS